MPPLLRTLRLTDLLFLFIGSVIGSGIFLTPSLILQQLDGSVGLSLLVWFVGGTLSLLGALTYAELAASNPEAGGLYCYIRDGFGRVPAFLYGWSLFLIIASGTIAALARAFTRYLAEIIPLSPIGGTVVGVAMIAVDHAHKSRHGSRSQRRAALDGPPRCRLAASPGHFTTRIFTAIKFWSRDDRRTVGL